MLFDSDVFLFHSLPCGKNYSNNYKYIKKTTQQILQ